MGCSFSLTGRGIVITQVRYDWLQKRLAEFLQDATQARAVNGGAEVCIGSYIGTVRTRNEDRALVVSVSYSDAPEKNFVLGVVCDGIGGLPRGDEASTVAVSEFCARTIRLSKLPPETRLLAAANGSNEAVYSLLKGKGGATLSAAMIWQGQAFGVNVGDSRIYGISPNKQTIQLTKDDTLAGYLGRRDGRTLNTSDNGLVQFIGLGEGLEPHPIYSSGRSLATILITTDGVHGAPADALAQVSQTAPTNMDLVQRLLSLSAVLGGRDNATAIAIPASYIPARLSQRGVNITCTSPFNRLEVWIPISENPPVEKDEMLESATKKAEPKDRDLKQGRKTRKKKKKQPGRDPNRLPLDEDEPVLDISFPEKQKS